MKLKLVLSAALIIGGISAHAVTETPAPGTNAAAAMAALFGDPVIAKGKGFEIKRSELDQVLSGAKANAAAQGQTLPPNFELELLNQLITIQMLMQRATPADRTAGQAEADEQYDKLVKQLGSPAALERQLKLSGITLADLRTKASQEAIAKTTLKRELNVSPTEDEAKEFYTKHAAEFEQPELAHVRHILLLTIDPATRTGLLTNTINEKRKQIEDIRKRAAAGEDFAGLAKQYSEDPGSKENGGEVPPFPRGGQMAPEFESAAFGLSSNQVSEVITTMYGFHVLKAVENKSTAKKYNFTDTIPQLKETVASICKKQVEGEKIKTQAAVFIKKLRSESNIEMLDPTLKSQQEAAEAVAATASEPTK
ncbi:MAG: peptidylprolyl isomerase [Verrucomicrobiota bacterium]